MRFKTALLVLAFPVAASAQTPRPLVASIDVSSTTTVTSSAPRGTELFDVNIGVGAARILPNDVVVARPPSGGPIVIDIVEVNSTVARGTTESKRGSLPSGTAIDFRAWACAPLPGVAASAVTPTSAAGFMQVKITDITPSGSSANVRFEIALGLLPGAAVVALLPGGKRIIDKVDNINGDAGNVSIPLQGVTVPMLRTAQIFVARAMCARTAVTRSIPLALGKANIASVSQLGPTRSKVVVGSGASSGIRPGEIGQLRLSSGSLVPFRFDSVSVGDAFVFVDQTKAALTGGTVEFEQWDCGSPVIQSTNGAPPNGTTMATISSAQLSINGTKVEMVASAAVSDVVPGSNVILTGPGGPIFGGVDRISGNGFTILAVTPSANNALSRVQLLRTMQIGRSGGCRRP